MALAIFDLDETLIHGDCASLWSEQMARLGWVDGKDFLRRDRELMEAYGKGHLQMEDYMAFSLEPIAGRTLEEVEHLVAPWVEEVIEPIIYGDACRCIAEHRQRGDRILIISASVKLNRRMRLLSSALSERLGSLSRTSASTFCSSASSRIEISILSRWRFKLP